jgi:voltage-gated potassium channel Kch
VFALVGFSQLALSFAAIYLLLPDGSFSTRQLGGIEAVYFSFVTITTLGYGDVTPARAAYGVQLLIVAEVFAGFGYVSALLATMISWTNDEPSLPTLEKVIQSEEAR